MKIYGFFMTMFFFNGLFYVFFYDFSKCFLCFMKRYVFFLIF